jgi:predicted ATPase
MKIESIRIKNYKIFKDIFIRDIPNMAVFLGANGSGKSTLFDVFGFLHDALINNVRSAITKRGGFKEIVSRGENGPIDFEIKFRPNPGQPIVTYNLTIGLDKKGIPVVKREILKYRRGQKGKPWHFLDFSEGVGVAIINEDEYGLPDAEPLREEQKLDSPDILAIKGLGQFQKKDH